MSVQNLWPLAFLVLVPIIVLLYILKQKAKDQPFSSTMLWQEIYKNLEAKTPFEKLKQNILMYMQILLMALFIFALMAPVINRGGAVEENMVIVIDTSASMEYLYDGENTRLDHSIKLASEEIDKFSENSTVILISCDSSATVVYQGKDKSTLKKRLRDLTATEAAGTLDGAANLINTLVEDLNNVQILGYTDTDFSVNSWTKSNSNAAVYIESVYSEGENCSVDYVNYSLSEDGVEALCKITNYGAEEVTQDISLYANSQIVDIQTITLAAQESKTVYFAKQVLATDGSVILKAELSRRDCLDGDNSQRIAVQEGMEKSVLLLTEGNVFLEKSLSLDDNVSLYKSSDVNVIMQTAQENGQKFDLYVFDGIALPKEFSLESLSDTGGYLFINYEELPENVYITKDSELTNEVLFFKETEITEYVEEYSFGVTQAYGYVLPEWGIPLVKSHDGTVAGYYGSLNGHNIAVLGWDIHNTDLALQTEFPIFMYQLSQWILGDGQEAENISNFPVYQESMVIPMDTSAIEGIMDNQKTGGRAIRNMLLLLIIILLVVEWIVYIFQVNSGKKKQFLVVRCLVLLMVILAMAGVSVPKKQMQTETIFLVDVSESMSENIGEIEEYLKHILDDMPDKNMAGIILFGKDTAMEQFLLDKNIFSGFTTKPVTTSTNIEKAVLNACSMFSDGATRRLILITDGNENEGNMNLAAQTLKGNDIELYGMVMEDCIGSNEEVYIDGLKVPSVIHVGDRYNVVVSVKSNVETDAILTLFSGRITKGQKNIRLTKGLNQFLFEDIGEEGTIAGYKAVIEPVKDTISLNNTYVTYAEVEAPPKVLLVEGTQGEGAEFEKILQVSNIKYDIVSPGAVPITLSELNQYKAVITLNVHYDDLREKFPTVLEAYVKDYAGGYICIGGEDSYALGGYKGTDLEKILPVSMDLQGEKEIPKIAMAMVIDQSGSMSVTAADNSTVTAIDLAKQAAISAVNELRTKDEVGVLVFSDSYDWVVELQDATDLDGVKDKIRSIGLGGGTSIYPALEEAYRQLQKSDASIKHIILLTDGQDSFQGYEDLLERINQAGITVSSVAVGAESDQNLLSYIAEFCQGRYYYTDINNSIPRIFAQEVYLSVNTYLINEEFYPIVASNNEILDGVMERGCPALLGYVAASAKPMADVILESHRQDPILSTWQYGLGRTVAWNSDGSNRWTAQYALWENYPMLWSNIVHYVISDTEMGDDYLDISKEGNRAVVTYETKEYDESTKVIAIVTDEVGNSREVILDAVRPGVFQGSEDIEEIGVYSVSLRKMSGDTVIKSYNTAYANQYSVEYQFSTANTDFATFLSQVKGREITMEDDVWVQSDKSIITKRSLTVPLLILAMLLFLMDIIVRRLSLDLAGYMQKAWRKITGKVALVKAETRERNQEEREKKARTKENKQTKDSVRKEKKQKDRNTVETPEEKLDMNQLLKKKQDRN